MTADLSPHARRELDALAHVRGPGHAEAILIAHQRRDVGSCLCGWAELGKSHAGHQAQMLREAGLLISGPGEDGSAAGALVNTGHGHVRPRADGAMARCGGPGVCSLCSIEQAQLSTTP